MFVKTNIKFDSANGSGHPEEKVSLAISFAFRRKRKHYRCFKGSDYEGCCDPVISEYWNEMKSETISKPQKKNSTR